MGANRAGLIAFDAPGGRKPLGSGTLIGPRHVLTANHVLKGEPLAFRLEGYDFVSVNVVWRNPDLDVALLVADQEIRGYANPQWLTDISDRDRWSAWGYPKTTNQNSSTDEQVAMGWAAPCPPHQTALVLTVDAPPQVWAGMSGAGVWIGGKLAGVIIEALEGFSGKQLQATPVAQFVDDLEFRLALGFDPRQPSPILAGAGVHAPDALALPAHATHAHHLVARFQVVDFIGREDAQRQ